MNRFLNSDTTVGKAVKTLLYVGGSAALMAVLSNVTNHPEIFTPTTVALANVLIVVLKNYIDPNVKNF